MMNMKNMLGMSGRSMSDGRVRMSNGGSSIGGFMGMNANMGSMLAKDILGEKGRTISNRDREIAANIGRTRSIADVQAMDNEPMMQDRSPENQMFTIDAAINNLMTEYQMVVRNIPFAETIEEKQMAEMRAQNVADQIDQLQQQKINIQAQTTPILQDLNMMNTREVMGESGKTISNRDRQIISDLLDSISE